MNYVRNNSSSRSVQSSSDTSCIFDPLGHAESHVEEFILHNPIDDTWYLLKVYLDGIRRYTHTTRDVCNLHAWIADTIE